MARVTALIAGLCIADDSDDSHDGKLMRPDKQAEGRVDLRLYWVCPASPPSYRCSEHSMAFLSTI